MRVFRQDALRLFFRYVVLKRPYRRIEQFDSDLQKLHRSPYRSFIRGVVVVGYDDWRCWCQNIPVSPSTQYETLRLGWRVLVRLPLPNRESILWKAQRRGEQESTMQGMANILDCCSVCIFCSFMCQYQSFAFIGPPVCAIVVGNLSAPKRRLIFSVSIHLMRCTIN